MAANIADGRNTAAQKYDMLTLLGVVGLSGGPTLQRSMLRLITLATARYNWKTGEITVGRREIARLWAVDERTVKREMARLKTLGFLVLRRPGVRGRVSAYALDFDTIRAACDCARVGPDFVERMAAQPAPAPESGGRGEVIPFPQAGPEIAGDLSEWSAARRRLRHIGAAAHGRWIAPLERAGLADGRLILEAPSAYHAAYVERTFLDAIRDAVRAESPSIQRVTIRARG